jgi:hypothetical protein
MQMERRGVSSERGDINRAIEVTNRELSQLRARIKKVKTWLYSVPIVNAPTMIDMMDGLAGGKNLESHWSRVADLKVRASVLVFLQQNNITDVPQLAAKVGQMHSRQYDVSNRIKAIDRRMGTLRTHLAQTDIIRRHKALYKKYKALDPKKRGAFREKHAEAIGQYETAQRYMKDHLNGRTVIPEKDWRAEYTALTAERYKLCEEFYRLKDDVKNVERLRRSAENLMSHGAPEQARGQKSKRHDVDL